MGGLVSAAELPPAPPRGPEGWNLTTPPALATQAELETIRREVLRLLDDEWPKLKNTSLLSTWRARDQAMRRIGPPMMLIDWKTVEKLGKLPHSSQGFSITMEEAAEEAERQGQRFFIEMFSHRWLRRSHPDDQNQSKAKVLVQWAKYRASQGLATFYWIDFACINQYDIYPGISMLPLYVSSCNNILCFETAEYEIRAWCRLERVLFAAFVAPNNEFLHSAFEFDESAERLPNQELKPCKEEATRLPDPTKGSLSWQGDVGMIKDLTDLCKSHWGKCWKDGLLDTCEEKGKLQGIRGLDFKSTQIRLRKFRSPGVGDDAISWEPTYKDQVEFADKQVGNPIGGFGRGISDQAAARVCCRPRWGPPQAQDKQPPSLLPTCCSFSQTRDTPPIFSTVGVDAEPAIRPPAG
mmetsp:Transcript_42943/g.100877  ORF Transcript_42943/g.100877 Transcript_42943/m.100877 type:complete len:409 (-) Transcript_42943:141-1367(-)